MSADKAFQQISQDSKEPELQRQASPSKVFSSNLDVEYVISFRYNKSTSSDDSSPEEQFKQLLQALDKAGLKCEVRDGGNGNLLVFVRIRSERKLLGEVYRSRVRDWLHGVRHAAPNEDTQKSLTQDPLTDAERLRLVHSIITLPESEGGAGITPKQGDWDLVESVFPLHDHDFNKQWIKDWSTKWTIGPQDLKIIRDRFGEKIAFYFAFLQAYFIFLIFPAIFGVFCHLFLPSYSTIFTTINCLWTVIFVEYWSQQEKDLAVQWGVSGCSNMMRKRAEFVADTAVDDPTTGETAYVFPVWKRMLRQSIQFPFALLSMALLGVVIACTFGIEIFITEVYDGPLKSILKFLPTVILTTSVPTITGILTSIATKLNNFENYQNQDSYENALTEKLFVLNFITGYLPLFLTAFVYVPFGSIIVPYLDVLNVTVKKFGHEKEYTTSDTGFHINPSRLKAQMIYFVVTAQIVNFALESIVPIVKRKVFKKAKEIQNNRKGIATDVVKDNPAEKAFLDRVRNESELDIYDVTVDLREMIMQFGYLALFSPIWPSTALSFLINNLVELRADAAKICLEMQRPIPYRADSIGPWIDNLGFLTWLGSLTTSALVYLFSCSDIKGSPPRDLHLYGLLFALMVSEHVYFGARFIVRLAFSKIITYGKQQERAERFMVRKRYLEESSGMAREAIEKEEEATGGEYTGVGVVDEGNQGRGLRDGQLSEQFWDSQNGAQGAVAAGLDIIRYTKEKKDQ